MNQRAFQTLEFNKIIDRLVDFAASSLGKEKCRKLLPYETIEEIQFNQRETTDAFSRILKRGTISFSGIKDIRSSFMRLEVGSSLSIEELLAISSTLNVVLRVKSYNKEAKEENDAPDSLESYFSLLDPLTSLNNEIKRCILSEDEISDEASSGLKNVRRAIKNTNNKIHEQLNSIVNSSRNILQDGLITMRNGRYCLPVKQEYRNQFHGMIHDQSATGSTLFIEPAVVVKLNNDLRELAVKEQEEINKILAQLSELAAQNIDILKENLDILVNLDFIFSKASLSKQMSGSEPIFNQEGRINIKKGRHPLIDPNKVVPIDIRLGSDFNLLIITGPNTGGKTVSLKTVGLFTLMGQAGLHIPAFDYSELSLFQEVFADIGDEQSIEQSLSTFSSHMTNTISILKQANQNSLVLFDELGAGTDPTEGAALAMSILSYLHQQKIRTIATTHYSELKIFALSTEGIQNACCEFNVETLRPTYRLLIGIPGKSNAFAISGKLGLSEFIIEDAKKRIGKQDKNFEDVISDLEKSRIIIEKEQEQITQYKKEITQLKEKLKVKNEKIDLAKEHILREANEKAREILQEAKNFADSSIKKYNKWNQELNVNKEMEAERNALRNKLDDTQEKLAIKKKKSKNYKPADFKLGDSVQVLSLGLKGIVSSLPNAKGDLFVQMGILNSQVNIKDLELIDEEVITGVNMKTTGAGKIKMSKTAAISPQLNLIGKTTDEAISILDKYLDDAYLSHLPQVTIIHGRGTGALKNAVHTYLKRTKYVKSYRLGSFEEGNQGVTIVEF